LLRILLNSSAVLTTTTPGEAEKWLI
jgi:hypothetical protein